MSALDRRTIEEIITRFEMHSDLRDVFVEGARDESLLSWFFDETVCEAAVVYPVDTVDVPEHLTREIIYDGGNKKRLLALSRILENELAPECDAARCIVDRDFQDFGFPVSGRYVRVTDYACMEAYGVGPTPLKKLLRLFFGGRLDENDMKSIRLIVTFLFAARLAKMTLAPQAAWYSNFDKCCSLTKGVLYFDEGEFVRRLANLSQHRLDTAALSAEIDKIRATFPSNWLFTLQGHDMAEVAAWYARAKGVPQKVADPVTFQRAVFAALEINALRSYGLFQDLLSWACENSANNIQTEAPSTT